MTPGRAQEDPVATRGSRRGVDMAGGLIQDGPRCERGPGDQTRWPQRDPEVAGAFPEHNSMVLR
eukprot:8830498-Pyramimonas_sp.AAC.1